MLVADVERHIDAIDGLLGQGEWLVGRALSLADISVFAQIFCIRGSEEGAAAIAKRPRVETWMDRVDGATRAPSTKPASRQKRRRPAPRVDAGNGPSDVKRDRV